MQRSKPYMAAISLFGIAAALFVALFIHMAWFESPVTERARDIPDCHPVENIFLQVTEDESAPAGVRRTYSWVMEDAAPANSTLAFYLVHQYAEVYFGEKLMYSLNRSPDSLIGRSPGCCWVTIPVYPADSGKEVRVVLTPVYEATLKRFYQHGKTVTLLPENSAYEPIVLSTRDFEEGYARIVGVAKQVVRDL